MNIRSTTSIGREVEQIFHVVDLLPVNEIFPHDNK
jgi:hypothetical protein